MHRIYRQVTEPISILRCACKCLKKQSPLGECTAHRNLDDCFGLAVAQPQGFQSCPKPLSAHSLLIRAMMAQQTAAHRLDQGEVATD